MTKSAQRLISRNKTVESQLGLQKLIHVKKLQSYDLKDASIVQVDKTFLKKNG